MRPTRRRSRLGRIGLAALSGSAVLLLAACSGGAAPAPSDSAATGDVPAIEGTLAVYAAASLTATFTGLAETFEAENPGVTVELTFAGSSDLATQIIEGAPADVFASADERNMAKLAEAGLIEADAPIAFATNVLTIAVPPGNPAGVTSLADLENPDINTVVCAPHVPCGAATKMVEEAAGITISAVSEESAVTDVLGKVTSGEADAGLVYVSDAFGAGDAVESIDVPEAAAAVNLYPIAPIAETQHLAAAEAFIDFLTSEDGLGVLAAAGFGSP